MTLPTSEAPRWSLAQRVAFRFAFVFFGVLFCAPYLASQIPGVDRAVGHLMSGWARLTLAVGHHLLHRPDFTQPPETGSGDRLFDWVNELTVLMVSTVTTVVWSVADQRRPSYPRLWSVLRSCMRFTLGFVALSYGVIKDFGGQFPPPDASRLLQPYGESSPMGLMWTFMGASRAYVLFAGLSETVGGVLLFFRRTATLGALILVGVFTNVVMMNFCYDVPVKLYSSTYLVMALIIAAPDVGRLLDVVLLHRQPPPPAPWRRTFSRRALQVGYWVAKLGLIGWVSFQSVTSNYLSAKAATVPASWREGVWMVKRFVKDGHELPALVDDHVRWRRFRMQSDGTTEYLRWALMDGTRGPLFTAVADESQHRITLKPQAGAGETVRLSFVRSDDDHLQVSGKIDGAELSIETVRMKPGDSLLINRGFHWVNEVPFNR